MAATGPGSAPYRSGLIEVAARFDRGADAALQSVCEEIDRRLVERTPKKTGAAKANWNVGAGAPDMTSDRKKVVRPTVDWKQIRAGMKVWFTNALPYILRLEYGWSKQAPGGMIRLTAAELPQIIKGGAVVLRDSLSGRAS